jgi:nucleoside-diphosphate-sugar epimerase
MRVFVAGATGVIGQYLVPSLVAAGHEVTGTTRSPSKASQLEKARATPAVFDGLDRQAVLDAVQAAQPDVIVHQMTALASMRNFRNFDKESLMTEARGSSNAKARRELGWAPRYPSWRDGFPVWVDGLKTAQAAHDRAA